MTAIDIAHLDQHLWYSPSYLFFPTLDDDPSTSTARLSSSLCLTRFPTSVGHLVDAPTEVAYGMFNSLQSLDPVPIISRLSFDPQVLLIGRLSTLICDQPSNQTSTTLNNGINLGHTRGNPKFDS